MEENNRNEIIGEETKEFGDSTIFSAPSQHTDKGKKGKYSLIKKIIAAVLCVAILAGVSFAVVKLIPEKTPEQIETNNGYQVINVNPLHISKITINHSEGQLVLLSSLEENKDKELAQKWSLEGYDNSLIDSASLEQIASYAATITAFGEYEDDGTADYGMSSPRITVTVEGTQGEPYTIFVGNDTAVGSYSYVKISTAPNKVYLVNSSTMTGFVVDPLDLAINTAIPKVEKTGSTAGYFDEQGTLADFDTITVSGKKLGKTLVFKPNDDGKFSDYATYICTSPLLRVANDVEDLLDIFKNGVPPSSAVSFDQSEEKIKEFGLDNPEWIITLKLGAESYTYRITPTDENNVSFYVASSTDKMIRTATASNLAFTQNEEKDFYLGFMALESIRDVSEFSLKGEMNTSFSINYDEDNEKYIVKNSGKDVVGSQFQSFYSEFMQITVIDYNTVTTSQKPSLTLTMKHHDGSDDTVLTFTKISDSRYQFTSGGNAMGQIPATSYDRLLRLIEKLIPA